MEFIVIKYPGLGKIQYIRQKDSYSCGAIALINIVKWSEKIKLSIKNIHAIRTICNTSDYSADEIGTYVKDFNKAIRYFKNILKIKRIQRPRLSDLDECLDSKGIIAIRYVYDYRGDVYSHFAIIVGRDNAKYTFVNDGCLYSTLIRSGLSKRIKHTFGKDYQAGREEEKYCQVWLIHKRKT